MTDAEFLDEIAGRIGDRAPWNGTTRITLAERDRLVALAREGLLRVGPWCIVHYEQAVDGSCAKCDGDRHLFMVPRAFHEIAADAQRLIDSFRTQLASRDEELRLLRAATDEYIAAHATMRSRFQTAEYAQRYEDAARALYRCLADPRARREEKP